MSIGRVSTAIEDPSWEVQLEVDVSASAILDVVWRCGCVVVSIHYV